MRIVIRIFAIQLQTISRRNMNNVELIRWVEWISFMIGVCRFIAVLEWHTILSSFIRSNPQIDRKIEVCRVELENAFDWFAGVFVTIGPVPFVHYN